MAPGTRTPNARKLPDEYAGLPRDLNSRLAANTLARLKAVFCLPAPTEIAAKHQAKEHLSQAFNAELSGALVMEAKPQCKGRPAAIGRVLQRLVKCRLPGALFWQPNRMPTPDTLQDLDPLRQEPEHRAGGNYPMITPDCPAT